MDKPKKPLISNEDRTELITGFVKVLQENSFTSYFIGKQLAIVIMAIEDEGELNG